MLSSRSRRDKLAKEVSDLMAQLEDNIVLRVANLLKSMNDLTPQCKALLSIWDDFGFYVCKMVATPAQGLWVACAVTAIGALAVYSALFKATAFLKRFEEDSEEVLTEHSSLNKSRTHKSSHESRVVVRKSGSKGSAKRRSRKSKSKKARSRKSRSRKSKSKKHHKSAKKARDMMPNETLGETPADTSKHQLRESAGRAPGSCSLRSL